MSDSKKQRVLKSSPDGWIIAESRSRPGRFYYWNVKTGEKTWTNPKNFRFPGTDLAAKSTKQPSSQDRRSSPRVSAPPVDKNQSLQKAAPTVDQNRNSHFNTNENRHDEAKKKEVEGHSMEKKEDRGSGSKKKKKHKKKKSKSSKHSKDLKEKITATPADLSKFVKMPSAPTTSATSATSSANQARASLNMKKPSPSKITTASIFKEESQGLEKDSSLDKPEKSGQQQRSLVSPNFSNIPFGITKHTFQPKPTLFGNLQERLKVPLTQKEKNSIEALTKNQTKVFPVAQPSVQILAAPELPSLPVKRPNEDRTVIADYPRRSGRSGGLASERLKRLRRSLSAEAKESRKNQSNQVSKDTKNVKSFRSSQHAKPMKSTVGTPPSQITGFPMSVTRMTGKKMPETQVPGTQVSGTQESGTQGSGAQVSRTQVFRTQMSRTQASRTEMSRTQVSRTQGSGTPTTGSRMIKESVNSSLTPGINLQTEPSKPSFYQDTENTSLKEIIPPTSQNDFKVEAVYGCSYVAEPPVLDVSQKNFVAEAMDIDDERQIISDIQALRSSSVDWKTIDPEWTPMETEIMSVDTASNSLGNVIIVLDTNILLSHLNFVKSLRDSSKLYGNPLYIYLPWMVIQELDRLKERGNTSKSARAAVSFINDSFKRKHPRVRGQTGREATHARSVNTDDLCPDDSILESCLQLKQQGFQLILLSNDVNLCNKALINDIKALTKIQLTNEINNYSDVKKTLFSEQVVSSEERKISAMDRIRRPVEVQQPEIKPTEIQMPENRTSPVVEEFKKVVLDAFSAVRKKKGKK